MVFWSRGEDVERSWLCKMLDGPKSHGLHYNHEIVEIKPEKPFEVDFLVWVSSVNIVFIVSLFVVSIVCIIVCTPWQFPME